MHSVTIGENQANQRLDKFLRKFMPAAGSGFLYKMLRKKNITLNGKRAEGNEIVSIGDTVSFFFSDETFEKMKGTAPEKEALPAAGERSGTEAEYLRAFDAFNGSGIGILYEDRDILILDKPAGILTQKADAGDISLNEWMIGYLLRQGALAGEELRTFKPSVCNRLDRNTSGIVLCGKSLAGSQYLSRCIRERSIRKFYHTVCVGEFTEESLLRGYLTKDYVKNKVTVTKAADCNKPDGAYIETVCRPLAAAGGFTLLEAELITGKPHQIRAHLADAGHPLIGDAKYGSRQVNRRMRERYGLTCQLLHACRIEFPDTPVSGFPALRGRAVCAPYPEIFAEIMEDLKLRG